MKAISFHKGSQLSTSTSHLFACFRRVIYYTREKRVKVIYKGVSQYMSQSISKCKGTNRNNDFLNIIYPKNEKDNWLFNN